MEPALSPNRVDPVRFVPSRWVVAAAGLLRLALAGRELSALGVGALVWSLTPRKVKLVAAGLAGAALITVAGALAALVLLAMQLA